MPPTNIRVACDGRLCYRIQPVGEAIWEMSVMSKRPRVLVQFLSEK